VPSSEQQRIKREERNQTLSTYPVFISLNRYNTYFVNQSMTIDDLHYLIYLAENTRCFSIDTECDKFTNQPALIQVELIDEISTVLLIEICHLPQDQSSIKFKLIRSIVHCIFQTGKMIYTWGKETNQLTKFTKSNLFTADKLSQPEMIDLQTKFTEWHTGKYGIRLPNGNKWSLQCAISDTLGQFLDKSKTLQVWSRGLYRKHDYEYTNNLLSIINYAINDCLAVTKIAYIMGEDIGSTIINLILLI
jgi:hypothetical protein